jgi:hypothetical protein
MATEFTCEACGVFLFDATGDAPPDPPICRGCRWLRSSRPRARKAIERDHAEGEPE